MSRKIIGVTVGTPVSASKIRDELKPVRTVNNKAPDANGNVNVEGGGGVAFETDDTLTLSNGTLSVNTINAAQEGSTRPITSGAVYEILGNIENALAEL